MHQKTLLPGLIFSESNMLPNLHSKVLIEKFPGLLISSDFHISAIKDIGGVKFISSVISIFFEILMIFLLYRIDLLEILIMNLLYMIINTIHLTQDI